MSLRDLDHVHPLQEAIHCNVIQMAQLHSDQKCVEVLDISEEHRWQLKVHKQEKTQLNIDRYPSQSDQMAIKL